ncbi:deoxyribonuclease-1-like [Lineus longissimus]|uniref:deoxyribonuclease-1-like n=1 Tax=Lineus longissimus TaxID=88925 RepID=UPI002B4D092A
MDILRVVLCQAIVLGLALASTQRDPGIAYPALKIASFNIQAFGGSKTRKLEAFEVIKEIIRRYDIVVVQEIRDAKMTAFPYLLAQVNQMDPSNPYESVVSARLGRTNSKEQYGFLYDPNKVSVTDTYQYEDGPDDGLDAFEREPFAVRFSSPTTEVSDFAIINVHIKPNDAVREIGDLTHVYDTVEAHWDLEDIMFAGDFNGDCNYVTKEEFKSISLRTDSRFSWLTSDCEDTTSGSTNCAYDRFVAAGSKLIDSVVPGSSGVFDFKEAYGLTQEQTRKVSDHFPIVIELAGEKIYGVQTNLQTYWSFKILEENYVTNVNNIRAIYRSPAASYTTMGLKDGTMYYEAIARRSRISNVMNSLKEFQEAYPGVISDNMLSMVQAHFDSKAMQAEPPYVYGLDEDPRLTFDVEVRCSLQDPLDCSVTVERRTH